MFLVFLVFLVLSSQLLVILVSKKDQTLKAGFSDLQLRVGEEEWEVKVAHYSRKVSI
jgi:hypothetical protein